VLAVTHWTPALDVELLLWLQEICRSSTRDWVNAGRRDTGRTSNGMGSWYPQPKVVGNVIAGSLAVSFPGHWLMATAGERIPGWIGR